MEMGNDGSKLEIRQNGNNIGGLKLRRIDEREARQDNTERQSAVIPSPFENENILISNRIIHGMFKINQSTDGLVGTSMARKMGLQKKDGTSMTFCSPLGNKRRTLTSSIVRPFQALA